MATDRRSFPRAIYIFSFCIIVTAFYKKPVYRNITELRKNFSGNVLCFCLLETYYVLETKKYVRGDLYYKDSSQKYRKLLIKISTVQLYGIPLYYKSKGSIKVVG